MTVAGARNWRDYALLFALACCWSSTYHWRSSLPDPACHLHLGALADRGRLPVRDPVADCRGVKIPTDAKAWKLFATQQLINSTFPFLVITWSQQYVPASNTVVLASTTPIFAFLITSLSTRHEPATLLKLIGAILGLAGTIAIIGLDALRGFGGEIVAEIAILLATISFACATIFGLGLSDYDPMVVAAGSLLFGGLVLLPPSLIIDSLDAAPDANRNHRHHRHGHLLERARPDAVLPHVPGTARH